MVIVDTYGLNIRNSFWGDKRHEYLPERFLGLKPAQVTHHCDGVLLGLLLTR
jgi:hypothetical protein